jgi:nucleoside-diphosphate-sugar epimerase
MKNYKIIVAGAKGNIGSIIFEKLKKEFKVFGLSKKNLYKENIYNFNYLKKNIGEFDILINASGINPAPYSKLSSTQVYKKNINLNNKLISLIKTKKIKKIIFLSSFSVYRIQKNIDEKTELNIRNLYSRSKIDFENKISKLNIPTYILRIGAILSDSSKYNWLSKIKRLILENKEIIFYNPNNTYNNCLEINDLIKVIRKLLHPKFNTRATYNLSSNGSIKIKNIINIIRKIKFYKKQITIKKIKLENFYNNSRKIQQDLNLKFKTSNQVIKKFFRNIKKKKLILIGSHGLVGSNFYKLTKNYFNVLKINRRNFDKYVNKNIAYYDNAIILFAAYDNKSKHTINANVRILEKLIKNLDIKKIDKFFYISSLHSHNHDYKLMHKLREKMLEKFCKKKLFLIYPGKIYGGENYNPQNINNNYGINSFINEIRKGAITMYGNGKNYCPHIFINDLVQQIFLLIKNNHNSGKYYLYPNNNVSFENLAKTIIKISGKNDITVKKIGSEKKYKIIKPFVFDEKIFKYSILKENLKKILNN